jgi:uncharacterized RDD family membrane protein YckC
MLQGTAKREDFFVRAHDSKRQLGALVDIGVSFAIAVAAVVATIIVSDITGGGVPFVLFIGILLVFWALDVLVYAVPVSRWGWSVGGLLTGCRVIDRATGGPLPFRRAVRRYFARRWAGLLLRFRLRAELNSRGRAVVADSTESAVDAAVGSAVVKTASWNSPDIMF